jgi:hypothetical protein
LVLRGFHGLEVPDALEAPLSATRKGGYFDEKNIQLEELFLGDIDPAFTLEPKL